MTPKPSDEERKERLRNFEEDRLRLREMERKTAALEDALKEQKRVEEALQRSEATLSTIFRAAPIGIGIVKDRILGWSNEQLQKMIGYSGEELTGRSARILYESDEEFERVGRVKHPQVLERGVGVIETRFRHRDGTVIDILLSSSSIVPGDLSQGLVFTATDITERKRAVEALRESEEKYRTVVENSNDAIFIAQDGMIKFPNTRTLEFTGYCAEDLSLLPFSVLIHPDDREMVLERHRRRLRGEDVPNNYSFRIIRRDGAEEWVQLNGVRITWDGRPATLNVVRDISEQRRLQIQLQQAQKMEAIGTLAGGIAHDFNNILTPIIVRTEIALLDVHPESPVRGHLEQVLRAAERAGELVKQILTFSRQGEQQRRPLRMGPIVKEALKFLRSTLPTTIEIRQEIQGEAAVLADPTEVHQVIMNLCTNAAHAMRQKGGLLDVGLHEVVVCPDGSGRVPGLSPGPYLRLSVRDTGTGMEPWMLEKIFDPYFTTKDKGEGTGLGLSVVHGIITSLKGAIRVWSRPGEGSLFTVHIPAIPSATAAEGPVPEALLRGGPEKVLLVDDDPIILETVTAMLRKLGYDPDARADPREALEVLRADPGRYDAVITDQTMPGMTGGELAAQILCIRPEIPVILCTGHSELITDERAKCLGIREFVMKPIEMRLMAETIRRALDEKRTR
jgi:PAS domain S-box-containing protein